MTKRYARVMPQQATLLDTSAPIPVETWRNMQKGEGPSKSEQLHEKFRRDCVLHGLPNPEAEHTFAKEALGRRWQFDHCWRQFMVAVEIEGIVVRRALVAELADGHKQPITANGRVVNVKAVKPQLISLGRHASIDGFREDCVKYNSAALLGWTVLRFDRDAIQGKDAIEMTVRVLSARGWRAA